MKYKQITLFAIIFFSTQYVTSQYLENVKIVFKNLDTLTTKAKISKFDNYTNEFVYIKKEKEISVSSVEILSYTFDDRKFYGNIDKSSFVEVLVEGSLSLYKNANKYYFRTENDSIVIMDKSIKYEEYQVKNERKIRSRNLGILKVLIYECDEGINIKNSVFNDKDLTNLVVKYNQCIGKTYYEFNKEADWSKVKFGISGGWGKGSSVTKATFESAQVKGKFDLNISPFFGGIASINLPRFSNRYSCQLELLFNYNKFDRFKKIEHTFYKTSTESYYNTLSVSLPVSLKYRLLSNKVNLDLLVGIMYERILDSKYTLKTNSLDFTTNAFVADVESGKYELSKNQYGLSSGFNLSFTKVSLEKFELSTRYNFKESVSLYNPHIIKQFSIGLNYILK